MTAVAPTSRAVASSIVSSSPSSVAPVVRVRGRRGKLTPADLPPPARARAASETVGVDVTSRARLSTLDRDVASTSPRVARARPHASPARAIDDE